MALAALTERDTRRGDLVEQRDAPERGNAAAQRATNPPARASSPSAISATSSGVGTSLEALARSNRAVGSGLDLLASHVHAGRLAVRRGAGDRVEIGLVGAARGRLTGIRSARSSHTLPGTAAAATLVGSALDGVRDDVAAVAVLVEIGGRLSLALRSSRLV